MKIISEIVGFKIGLTIPDGLKGEGMSDEGADRLINLVYKPFIDKITIFLAYSIGSKDFNAIEIIKQVITSIARSKLQNR